MLKLNLPKLTIKAIQKILISLVVVVLVFSTGFAFGKKDTSGENIKVNIDRRLPESAQTLDFSLFWQVWDTLGAFYFDSENLNEADMVYGAIKGMVAAVGDPYTVFLSPRENEVTAEDLDGSFQGVGIQIGYRGNKLAVIAPLPDSPAERAGIRPGDIIAGIKDDAKKIDTTTQGMTLPEAVQIIRGQSGTKITLALLRDSSDQIILVDVTRQEIQVPSVILTFVGENQDIAHLRVLKFGAETEKEWNNAIIEILKKNSLKGIALDVRNDPGGYLQGAVDLASDFLETGNVVVIEEKADGTRQEFKTTTLGRLRSIDNVVVLVNKGSASASEILAAALRDNKKIRLVGEATFGKGTIQDRQELDGGVALHITTARWLTPKNTWVNEKGLEPDIQIEDDTETSEDEQLEEALRLISAQ